MVKMFTPDISSLRPVSVAPFNDWMDAKAIQLQMLLPMIDRVMIRTAFLNTGVDIMAKRLTVPPFQHNSSNSVSRVLWTLSSGCRFQKGVDHK